MNKKFDKRNYDEIFPYKSYRDQQETIIQNIINTLENNNSCVLVARNGAGKTILALSAVLSLHNSGIFILGRTHRQMDHFVEEFDTIKKLKGFDVDYIELLARSSYCINPDVRKLDRDLIDIACYNSIHKLQNSNESYCSYKGINNKKKINIDTPSSCNIHHGSLKKIRDYARSKKICPYYLARGLAQKFPVVIGTYMYIDKDIRMALGINLDGKIIVIDECHNIPSFLEEKQKRTININTIRNLKQKRGLTKRLSIFLLRTQKFIEEFSHILEGAKQKKISYYEFGSEMMNQKITPDFLRSVSYSLNILSKDNMKYEIVYSISKIVSFFEMYNQIDDKAFLGYVSNNKENGKSVVKIGIQSLDIAPLIKELTDAGAKLLFMSGTLDTEMFDFRLKLDKIGSKSFEYIFNDRRLQLYLVTKSDNGIHLSTEYYSRNDEIFKEYAITIKSLLQNIPKGILFFFPSYNYKKRIIEAFEDNDLIKYYYDKDGNRIEYLEDCNKRKIRLFNDTPNTKSDNIENFKAFVKNNDAALFAVYRSRASEGEDYQNIKGIFIIGIPLANISDAGITLKMNYYDSLQSGYGYDWYNSDAMDAVNQACGRGIRKEKDYCVIFLMDKRYKQGTYFNHLSRWIRAGLVNNPSLSHHIPNEINRSLRRFYLKNAKINRIKKLE